MSGICELQKPIAVISGAIAESAIASGLPLPRMSASAGVKMWSISPAGSFQMISP